MYTHYNSTLGITYNVNHLWYAVMRDRNDDDWGYGTPYYHDALLMLKPFFCNDPTAYIAVIDDSNPANPTCIDELHFTLEEV